MTRDEAVRPRTGRNRSRNRKNRVTVKDVAERAGVGTMTVSRALRAPDSVSAKLRERIEQAVADLGYVPNRLAGGLASSRTRTVPVIIPSLSNAVFPDIVEGISSVLQRHDLQILLGNTQYSLAAEEALVSTFLSWSPDGVIITGLEHSERTRRMLAAAGIPVVEIVEWGEAPIDMNVGLSHVAAGRAMGEYLIGQGYRRIAFVGPQMERDVRAAKRLEGLRTALAAAGQEGGPALSLDRPSAVRAGGDAVSQLLGEAPDIDAVFFANDDMAVGGLLECQRRGIAVPGSLAIAGFNGLEFSGEVMPRLTTILTPRHEIGRRAAEMLVARLAGQAVAETRVDVGFTLLRRESA
ncbi:HTH-type transcriptional regulator GntR [Shumkonia mesophila]|uniref:LacI family DNA-binding transcriptional regulator n=1 Tax=Shumkonia mesophila TaxID=2838854 RepID=UPI0029348146|nr:LacI family DNA-binding transcriptional regulator [Shumkonia mesophila]